MMSAVPVGSRLSCLDASGTNRDPFKFRTRGVQTCLGCHGNSQYRLWTGEAMPAGVNFI